MLLAIWQVVGMLAGDFYVATPVQAVDALADGVSGGWFFDSLGATLAATALGFAIAAVAGLWIGVTLGLVRFWGNVFEPITLSVYSIPKVTLFPIFLTMFGFGLYSKIAFGMFHGIFPIVIIAMSATREVNPVHLKVARSLRLSRTATFRQVIFPSIFPSLLTGLRLGFCSCCSAWCWARCSPRGPASATSWSRRSRCTTCRGCTGSSPCSWSSRSWSTRCSCAGSTRRRARLAPPSSRS